MLKVAQEPQESKVNEVNEVNEVEKLSNNVKQGITENSTQTKFYINPDISNNKHILNNMEMYMVNNTLPKDYCIKQYSRIYKLNNTNEALNQLKYVSVLLDLEKK